MLTSCIMCCSRRPKHTKCDGHLHHVEGSAALGRLGRDGRRSARTVLQTDSPSSQHLQEQKLYVIVHGNATQFICGLLQLGIMYVGVV